MSVAVRCIHCGNHRASRSRRKTAWDWALSSIGIYPYRCGACETRFHARLRWESEDPPARVEDTVANAEPISAELKQTRRRKRKSWLDKIKEQTDVRREKKIRIGTQIAIYGFGLLTFLAMLYALMQYL